MRTFDGITAHCTPNVHRKRGIINMYHIDLVTVINVGDHGRAAVSVIAPDCLTRFTHAAARHSKVSDLLPVSSEALWVFAPESM